MPQEWPSLVVGEESTLSFTFTKQIPAGATLSDPVVTLILKSGTDASPDGWKSGSPVIDGDDCQQKVIPTASQVGNEYYVEMQVTESVNGDKRIATDEDGILPFVAVVDGSP